jgi:hypothetical protein
MRIEFTPAGGIGYFPALNKPATVEVDQLYTEGAEELKRLVAAVRFFDLPANVGVPARGAADYQHYILTVEENGRRHTVRVLVPVADPALLALVQAVQRYLKAAREAGPGVT